VSLNTSLRNRLVPANSRPNLNSSTAGLVDFVVAELSANSVFDGSVPAACAARRRRAAGPRGRKILHQKIRNEETPANPFPAVANEDGSGSGQVSEDCGAGHAEFFGGVCDGVCSVAVGVFLLMHLAAPQCLPNDRHQTPNTKHQTPNTVSAGYSMNSLATASRPSLSALLRIVQGVSVDEFLCHGARFADENRVAADFRGCDGRVVEQDQAGYCHGGSVGT